MINFLHVPKAAGSFLHEISERYLETVTYWGHIKKQNVPSPSFCFTRNPYDRLVSAYFYLRNSETGKEPDASYRELLMKYMSFKDFVMNIADDRLNRAIIHLKPMSHFICDEYGDIAIDKIFKIEDIEKIDEYLEGIGIDEKLSDISLNQSGHKPWRFHMDKEIVREINWIYGKDFELFNYEML